MSYSFNNIPISIDEGNKVEFMISMSRENFLETYSRHTINYWLYVDGDINSIFLLCFCF